MTTGLSGMENYAALRNLAQDVSRDEAIVEIGTFRGASALVLGHAAARVDGAHVWTIDPHDLEGYRSTTGAGPRPRRPLNFSNPAHRLAAEKAIRDEALEGWVTMINDFSIDAADEWNGPPIGLLYIDGDHREGSARRDFSAWERHLAPQAIVAFDDYHHDRFPGVVRVVDNLVEKGILSRIALVGSLAVTRRTR